LGFTPGLTQVLNVRETPASSQLPISFADWIICSFSYLGLRSVNLLQEKTCNSIKYFESKENNLPAQNNYLPTSDNFNCHHQNIFNK
jgi:hypothetical protein